MAFSQVFITPTGTFPPAAFPSMLATRSPFWMLIFGVASTRNGIPLLEAPAFNHLLTVWWDGDHFSASHLDKPNFAIWIQEFHLILDPSQHTTDTCLWWSSLFILIASTPSREVTRSLMMFIPIMPGSPFLHLYNIQMGVSQYEDAPPLKSGSKTLNICFKTTKDRHVQSIGSTQWVDFSCSSPKCSLKWDSLMVVTSNPVSQRQLVFTPEIIRSTVQQWPNAFCFRNWSTSVSTQSASPLLIID